jgi:hypothetical protein
VYVHVEPTRPLRFCASGQLHSIHRGQRRLAWAQIAGKLPRICPTALAGPPQRTRLVTAYEQRSLRRHSRSGGRDGDVVDEPSGPIRFMQSGANDGNFVA